MRCGSTEDARPKTRGDRKQERPSDWKLPAPSPILGTRTPKYPGYPQRCSLVGPGSLNLARPTGSTPRVFVANADLSFALLTSWDSLHHMFKHRKDRAALDSQDDNVGEAFLDFDLVPSAFFSTGREKKKKYILLRNMLSALHTLFVCGRTRHFSTPRPAAYSRNVRLGGCWRLCQGHPSRLAGLSMSGFSLSVAFFSLPASPCSPRDAWSAANSAELRIVFRPTPFCELRPGLSQLASTTAA